MVETPDYDDLVATHGDPCAVIAEVDEAIHEDPPHIPEAHGEDDEV